MGSLWMIVTIGGPILLGVGLLYVVLSNRLKRNQPPKEVSDRASRRLHERLDAEDKEREGRLP